MSDEMESCSNCGAAVDKEPMVLCDDCDEPSGMGASDAHEVVELLKSFSELAPVPGRLTLSECRSTIARVAMRSRELLAKVEKS